MTVSMRARRATQHPDTEAWASAIAGPPTTANTRWSANDRFPPTSVSQGWVRFVRFQEVGRTQRMTEKGAKPPGP